MAVLVVSWPAIRNVGISRTDRRVSRSIRVEQGGEKKKKLTGEDGLVRHPAVSIVNVGTDKQCEEVLSGSVLNSARFLLDEDPLPLLNDLHPHFVHNGFSAVPSIVSSKRLNPDSLSDGGSREAKKKN